MAAFQVSLRMEGFARDDGHVPLPVFLQQVQAFSSMLVRADELVAFGMRSTKMRVVDLTHTSPATITVEVRPKKRGPDVSELMLQAIAGVSLINQNPEQYGDRGRAFLKAFEELASPVGKRIPASSVILPDTEIALSQTFKATIAKILSAEETALGTVEGRLEAINLHDEANVFFVYPVIGANKVKCFFPSEMREEAISAIDKIVVVSGTTKYKAGDPYPFEIEADGLSANPDDSLLPKMSELYAIAPDITNGIPAEVFTRQLRDGWG